MKNEVTLIIISTTKYRPDYNEDKSLDLAHSNSIIKNTKKTQI